jgi:hypothetical protein
MYFHVLASAETEANYYSLKLFHEKPLQSSWKSKATCGIILEKSEGMK